MDQGKYALEASMGMTYVDFYLFPFFCAGHEGRTLAVVARNATNHSQSFLPISIPSPPVVRPAATTSQCVIYFPP